MWYRYLLTGYPVSTVSLSIFLRHYYDVFFCTVTGTDIVTHWYRLFLILFVDLIRIALLYTGMNFLQNVFGLQGAGRGVRLEVESVDDLTKLPVPYQVEKCQANEKFVSSQIKA
jgi:hypothetical protein